jgi:hypothetical protein
MIAVAAIVNLLMIRLRKMREFALVGVWALVAISIKQWGITPTVQWFALGCAVLLFITILVHAFQNRTNNPAIRMRKR